MKEIRRQESNSTERQQLGTERRKAYKEEIVRIKERVDNRRVEKSLRRSLIEKVGSLGEASCTSESIRGSWSKDHVIITATLTVRSRNTFGRVHD